MENGMDVETSMERITSQARRCGRCSGNGGMNKERTSLGVGWIMNLTRE